MYTNAFPNSTIPASPTFSLYTYLIEKSLSYHLHSNALFYASQLYTEYPNPQSLYLYANTLFLSKDYPQTHALLEHYKVLWCETFLSQVKSRCDSEMDYPDMSKNLQGRLSKNPNFHATHLDIQYLAKIFLLYAVTSIEMNNYQQAEKVLIILWERIQEGSITNSEVDRSTVAYYLGICCQNLVHRAEKAIQYFVEAAHAGMWCAIEKLAHLGYQDKTMHEFLQGKANEWITEWKLKYFQQQSTESMGGDGALPAEDDQSELEEEDDMREDYEKQFHGKGTPASSSRMECDRPPKMQKKKTISSRASIASTASGSSVDKYLHFKTPSPNLDKKEGSYGIISPPPSAHHVSFKTPSLGRSTDRKSDTSSIHSSQEWVTPSPNRMDHQTGPPPIHGIGSGENIAPKKLGASSRRSSVHSSQTSMLNQSNIANRLFVSSTTTPKPPQTMFTTPNSVISHKSKLGSDEVRLAPDDTSPTNSAHQFIHFIGTLGNAYQLFSLYKCQQSLSKFQKLTAKQKASPWVMGKIARCYFELEDYETAYEHFMQVTQLYPFRLEDLEYFSTTLWHLKKEKDLSFLALRMSTVNKFAPQTLIALGNCFSLEKDHEKSLQFFERATQLDPHFAYAYTLAGHENVENDDTDDAMHCYREALRIDNRHYNAWYGLGTVYHRQENHEKAKQHFEIALRIKPHSSVMRCYLGMTLKDCKMISEALKEFDRALAIMPNNPMTKFKRAEVLIELEDWEAARKELEDLKRLVPREAFLYSTLGDVYAQIGGEASKKIAVDYYQSALQLGFKDHSAIKEKIAMLFETELDNDSMEQ